MSDIILNQNNPPRNLVSAGEVDIILDKENEGDLIIDNDGTVVLVQVNSPRDLVPDECEGFVWTTIEW